MGGTPPGNALTWGSTKDPAGVCCPGNRDNEHLTHMKGGAQNWESDSIASHLLRLAGDSWGVFKRIVQGNTALLDSPLFFATDRA